ncbi:hypothetical protein FRC20_008593 [Serendipita sp. 405]|nr:hypothetical protein FRC20_008593 [Serendipita sp. 405]
MAERDQRWLAYEQLRIEQGHTRRRSSMVTSTVAGSFSSPRSSRLIEGDGSTASRPEMRRRSTLRSYTPFSDAEFSPSEAGVDGHPLPDERSSYMSGDRAIAATRVSVDDFPDVPPPAMMRDEPQSRLRRLPPLPVTTRQPSSENPFSTDHEVNAIPSTSTNPVETEARRYYHDESIAGPSSTAVPTSYSEHPALRRLKSTTSSRGRNSGVSRNPFDDSYGNARDSTMTNSEQGSIRIRDSFSPYAGVVDYETQEHDNGGHEGETSDGSRPVRRRTVFAFPSPPTLS